MDRKHGRLLPSMQDATKQSPHLGVYILLGALRRASCPCDVLDWVSESPGFDESTVAGIASQYQVVFFSSNSMNWAAVRLVAERVRELSPFTKLCVGGPHPTLYPDAVAGSGLFDAYFRGEADRYIHEIYALLVGQRTSISAVPGLWMPSAGFQNTPQLVQDDNLDQLDWRAAYDLVPADTFLSLPVETSRGCKYRCAFCSIPSKNNWRGYSASNAVEQLLYAESFAHRTKSGIVSIVDDTFTRDHSRVMQIMEKLPLEQFRRRLTYDATLVDLTNTELISALVPFTSDLLIGAEVVTVADAKKVTKPTSPHLIRRVAANLQQAGISSRAVFSFIMGFPWQNVEDCLNTVSFVTNLILEYDVRIYLQWYWPMPGSEIWKALESEGRVDVSITNTPGFYRSPEWFYSIRQITPEQLAEIDDRVRPVQLCLTLRSQQLGHDRFPLEYSVPQLGTDNEGWTSLRNPFQAGAEAARSKLAPPRLPVIS